MGETTRTKSFNSKRALLWLAIATLLAFGFLIVSDMMKVSPESWGALMRVSPRQLSFVGRFDRVVQKGMISYVNDFNAIDMSDPQAVAALNSKYKSIVTDAETFTKDCPEKAIAVKQAEFYKEMLLYEQALSNGDITELKVIMETSSQKVTEFIELLKEYGYKV